MTGLAWRTKLLFSSFFPFLSRLEIGNDKISTVLLIDMAQGLCGLNILAQYSTWQDHMRVVHGIAGCSRCDELEIYKKLPETQMHPQAPQARSPLFSDNISHHEAFTMDYSLINLEPSNVDQLLIIKDLSCAQELSFERDHVEV